MKLPFPRKQEVDEVVAFFKTDLPKVVQIAEWKIDDMPRFVTSNIELMLASYKKNSSVFYSCYENLLLVKNKLEKK